MGTLEYGAKVQEIQGHVIVQQKEWEIERGEWKEILSSSQGLRLMEFWKCLQEMMLAALRSTRWGMPEPMSMSHRHRHAGRDDTCELPELLAPRRDKCNEIFRPIWSPSTHPAELIHAERTALFFDISDITTS